MFMPLMTASAEGLQMTAAGAELRAPLWFLEGETEAPKSDYDTLCSACFMGLYGLKFHATVFFEKPFMGLLSSHKIVNKEKVTNIKEVVYSVYLWAL